LTTTGRPCAYFSTVAAASWLRGTITVTVGGRSVLLWRGRREVEGEEVEGDVEEEVDVKLVSSSTDRRIFSPFESAAL
jgi:hypothetical protein